MAKKNNKTKLQTLGALLVLFPLFNTAIVPSAGIYALIPYMSTFIGTILLLIVAEKQKITKSRLGCAFCVLVVTLVLLIHNSFLSQWLRLGTAFSYFFYLFIGLLLSIIKIDQKCISRVLEVCFLEHMIVSSLAIIVPVFYENNILSAICNGQSECQAIGNFHAGSNPGLTRHYSMNGTILTIATIYYYSKFYIEKNKKNVILLILAFALLLTVGKRAHPVIAIASILIHYLIYGKALLGEKIKKILKIFIIGALLVVGFIAASHYVPQLSTPLKRAERISKSDDISNGRKPLYDLAIKNWKDYPVFGKGWGSFSIDADVYSERYHTRYIEAHNDYLQMLAEMGIIGLIAYMYIVINIIKDAHRSMKRAESNDTKSFTSFVFLYILFFLLYGLTGHPLHTELTYALFIILSVQRTTITKKGIR